MAVYTLVSFPDWGLPYAKPRFIITSGGLRILNLPLLSPDAICARRSITELPFIEYDRGYNAQIGVAFLWTRANASHIPYFNELQAAARG